MNIPRCLSNSDTGSKDNDRNIVFVKEEPKSLVKEMAISSPSSFSVHNDENPNETSDASSESSEFKITLDDVKVLLDHSKYESVETGENLMAKDFEKTEGSEVAVKVKVEKLKLEEQEMVQKEIEHAKCGSIQVNKQNDYLQYVEEENIDNCNKEIKVECIFFNEIDVKEADEGRESREVKEEIVEIEEQRVQIKCELKTGMLL